MIDNRASFDFWTAVAVPEDFEPPEGMEVYLLPAGQYARCCVPNSAEILMTYSAVYGTWAPQQTECDINMMGPCFELYPPKWTQSDPFDLYVNVVAK